MQFVHPGFLFALLAIAIPIVIHLFNFRKFKKVYFPNVRFLKEVQASTRAKSKLKHLLVLLSRILAIGFLALAFAQPYIPSENTISPIQPGAISIYIDNSFSMNALGKEGDLLSSAKYIAEKIVQSHNRSAKFQVLSNNFSGIEQRLLSQTEALEYISGISSSPTSKSISEVYERQLAALKNGSRANNISYILSDFQSSICDFGNITPDTILQANLIQLKGENRNNVFIDSCWLNSPVLGLGSKLSISAKITNQSNTDIENAPIKLFMNGQTKSPGVFSVKSNESVNVDLNYTVDSTGIKLGLIEIEDYPISFDDKLFFNINVPAEINCLNIIQDTGSGIAKIFKGDSLIKYSEVNIEKLDHSKISSYNAIILESAVEISSGLSQELSKFVKEGGNLILFPSISIDLPSINKLLIDLGAGVFDKKDTNDIAFGKVNYDHIYFSDVFEKTQERIDLPKTFEHYPIISNSKTLENVLFYLQNNTPAVASYRSGKGNVILSGTGLDEAQSNLKKHALLVPVMFQSVLFSATSTSPLYETIGNNKEINVKGNLPLDGESRLKLRYQEYEFIPSLKRAGYSNYIFVNDQVKKAGNYLLSNNEQLIQGVAFNYDRRESNTKCMDEQTLKESLELNKLLNFRINNIANFDISGEKLVEANTGASLWKLCIILALAFLAIEVLLIRILN